MKALRPVLLALAFALPAVAQAQWQWLDKDGRKVFSDRPPPADIAPNRILKQPGQRAAPADAAAAPAAAASGAVAVAVPATAAAPKVSGKDKGLEEKKKQQEAAEAEKKKAEEAKVAQARADNCNRAKQSKAAFDSGVRIARTNAKGETEYLDDAQRASEMKRLTDLIARDCR